MSTVSDSMDSSFDSADHVFLSEPAIYTDGSQDPITQWTRENAIRLEEKEKREREMLRQIIEEADGHKDEFYRKRVVSCQKNKASNRELVLMDRNKEEG